MESKIVELSEAKRVLICGSRDFTARYLIDNVISRLPRDVVIIEGGAKGADTMAKETAIEQSLKWVEYKAEWHIFGAGAGPIRNKKMLVNGKPDLVLAFYSSKENSKGTANMVKQAREASVEVIEYEQFH